MHKAQGIALFELIIALFIIAIVGGVLLPRLRHKTPAEERKEFVASLNALLLVTRQNALITQRLHKIVFDFEKRKCFSEVQLLPGETKDKLKHIKELVTQLPHWPESIDIVQFFIKGEDEIKKFPTLDAVEKIWFYMIPDGLVQPVIINMLGRQQNGEEEGVKISLVLNPFRAYFKVYDEFKKPK